MLGSDRVEILTKDERRTRVWNQTLEFGIKLLSAKRRRRRPTPEFGIKLLGAKRRRPTLEVCVLWCIGDSCLKR